MYSNYRRQPPLKVNFTTPPMSNVTLNFTREEYDRRIAKTRAAMAEAGIELLIVYDPSNKSWLTGYDGWSFYVHECVLLAMEGEPVYVGRGMDAVGATRTTFMAHDNIIGYPDHLVQNPPLHAMTWMAEEVLPARGWDKLRIGVGNGQLLFQCPGVRQFAGRTA